MANQYSVRDTNSNRPDRDIDLSSEVQGPAILRGVRVAFAGTDLTKNDVLISLHPAAGDEYNTLIHMAMRRGVGANLVHYFKDAIHLAARDAIKIEWSNPSQVVWGITLVFEPLNIGA